MGSDRETAHADAIGSEQEHLLSCVCISLPGFFSLICVGRPDSNGFFGALRAPRRTRPTHATCASISCAHGNLGLDMILGSDRYVRMSWLVRASVVNPVPT